ncbi:MAG: Smr/MutS family protein [Bacteroidota bacterium]
MIKLGDKVRFVNENMQGVVTSIKGNTAGVTIEDDFEIPVMLSELVKINDILTKPGTESEKPVTVKANFVKIHSGFHVAFDRVDDNILELKFHNSESDLALVAVYENARLKHTITVEIEKNVGLGKFALDQFNQWPEFTFVITPLEQEYKTHTTITKRVKFHAKEFHAGFKQCYFLGRQAYSFRLDSDIKQPDIKRLMERDFAEPLSSAKEKPLFSFSDKPEKVVDLHIDRLVGNSRELSPQAMVDLQMKAVEHAIETGHIHKMKSLVLIHGVGNHYLKNKVKNYLSVQKNIVERYADADMLTFGGGATEVWLK